MTQEEILKTRHYRCLKCGMRTPLTQTRCSNYNCGADLLLYGQVVEPENTAPSGEEAPVWQYTDTGTPGSDGVYTGSGPESDRTDSTAGSGAGSASAGGSDTAGPYTGGSTGTGSTGAPAGGGGKKGLPKWLLPAAILVVLLIILLVVAGKSCSASSSSDNADNVVDTDTDTVTDTDTGAGTDSGTDTGTGSDTDTGTDTDTDSGTDTGTDSGTDDTADTTVDTTDWLTWTSEAEGFSMLYPADAQTAYTDEGDGYTLTEFTGNDWSVAVGRYEGLDPDDVLSALYEVLTDYEITAMATDLRACDAVYALTYTGADGYGELYLLATADGSGCYLLELGIDAAASTEENMAICRTMAASFEITGAPAGSSESNTGGYAGLEVYTDDDGWQFVIVDSEAVLVGYTGAVPADGMLSAPDTYEDLYITGMAAGAISGLDGLEMLLLPYYLEEIESGAIVNCPDLALLASYDCLTAVGADSIRDCDSLSSVVYYSDTDVWSGNLPAGSQAIYAYLDTGVGALTGSSFYLAEDHALYGLTDEDIMVLLNVPDDLAALYVEDTIDDYYVFWIWSGALDCADALTEIHLGLWSCYDYSMNAVINSYTIYYHSDSFAEVWMLNCDIADRINEGRGYNARHIQPDLYVVFVAWEQAAALANGSYADDTGDLMNEEGIDWLWMKEFSDSMASGDYAYSEIYSFIWDLVDEVGLINEQTGIYYNRLGVGLCYGDDAIVCEVIGVYSEIDYT